MTDNPFHSHLETCQECRENPFALCAAGAVLLESSATRAAETARLRGEVLRLALLAAGGAEADFLAAARALAPAIIAATAPPVEGLWTDLVERLHAAAGPLHDSSGCAPDQGFPSLCSACRQALHNRILAVAPGVLAARAGQAGWATAKGLLVLLRGVEAFGLLAAEPTPPTPAEPQEGGARD